MSGYLRNPGFDDRFTCPACFFDFSDRRATKCPSCDASIKCWVETEPVAMCELVTADEEETSP